MRIRSTARTAAVLSASAAMLGVSFGPAGVANGASGGTPRNSVDANPNASVSTGGNALGQLTGGLLSTVTSVVSSLPVVGNGVGVPGVPGTPTTNNGNGVGIPGVPGAPATNNGNGVGVPGVPGPAADVPGLLGLDDGTNPADDHPVPDKSVVVTPATGDVQVQGPGSGAWQSLGDGGQLPMGSLVDARHGSITLHSAVGAADATQTGTFWGGVFQVRQGNDGATVLVLRGPRPDCAKAPTGSVAVASANRRRAAAGLWGHDHGGKFRTRGRNSVATVRGTTWFVQERCGGTYTKVTHGAVMVRDSATGHTTLLHAGQSHLARTPHRRTRS